MDLHAAHLILSHHHLHTHSRLHYLQTLILSTEGLCEMTGYGREKFPQDAKPKVFGQADNQAELLPCPLEMLNLGRSSVTALTLEGNK